ncbi:MAG: hypothetical protein ACK42H_12895, partial [Planctomycetota bacterium]
AATARFPRQAGAIPARSFCCLFAYLFVFKRWIMDLEIINKLFLELSQFATATTAREVMLFNMLKEANDVLCSSMAIARREGKSVNWESYTQKLEKVLDEQHKILYPEA